MRFREAREYKGHIFKEDFIHVANPENLKLHKWFKKNGNNPERFYEIRRVPKQIIDIDTGLPINFESRVVGVFIDGYDSHYNPKRTWTELKRGDVVYFEDIKETRLNVMSELEFNMNYQEILSEQ